MSIFLRLKKILFQDDVRSRPHRENYQEIENRFNDLKNQFDASLSPPVGSEVPNARDYHTVLRDRMRSASTAQGNVLISGGAVTPQSVPNMTVNVAAGEAIVAGVACKWAASVSGTIVAPAGVGTYRYDAICINSDNSLSVVTATTEAAEPVPIGIASTQKALYLVRIDYGQTTITAADIFLVDGQCAVDAAGFNIIHVERALNVVFKMPFSVGGVFKFLLPGLSLQAGDTITIIDSRNPSIGNYIRVRQFYSSVWHDIENVWGGTVQMSVLDDDPLGFEVITTSKWNAKFVDEVYASAAACDAVSPLKPYAGSHYTYPVGGSCWNLTTGLWTAAIPGVIRIEFWWRMTLAGSPILFILKNGAVINEGPISILSDGAGTAYAFNGAYKIIVAAGDTVEFRTNSAASAASSVVTVSYERGE